MRILWLSLILLLLPVRAEAQTKLLSPQEFSVIMQPRLPLTTSTGNIVTRIEAEGNLLVWTVQIVTPELDVLGVDRMAVLLARGWCDMPLAEAYFNAGYTVRMDTQSTRLGLRKGKVVRSCK